MTGMHCTRRTFAQQTVAGYLEQMLGGWPVLTLAARATPPDRCRALLGRHVTFGSRRRQGTAPLLKSPPSKADVLQQGLPNLPPAVAVSVNL